MRVIGQSIFSVIAAVDSARISALEAVLTRLDAAIAHFPLQAIETLHFCSFTIFPDDRFGPYLVFESNIDGSPRPYIGAICSSAAPLLHEIYSFCTDYRAAAADPALLEQYLHAHLVHADTAFVANVGRSARRIRDEAALVDAIEDFLDRYATAPSADPQTVAKAVRDFVGRNPAWAWVWRRAPRLSFSDRVARWSAVGGFAAALLAVVEIVPMPLLLSIAFTRTLRRLERTDPISIPGPPAEHVERLTDREDRIGQNHMASLCYVKPGAFRRALLRLVLFGANLYARISTNGKLSGLDSLHFAHWSLIDDDTRLLFLTNYDGSWENYLDDFIEKAAYGLTAIWSNTLNFPRTRWLVLDGARDERKFKQIARTTQAYTNVWYSAYPNLTATGIGKNSAICDAFAQPPKRIDEAAWLRLF